MTANNTTAHYPLRDLALSIAVSVEEKDKTYGSSWKKRGGTGAAMMMARKWDRIENQAKAFNWDIFKTAEVISGKEGVLDDMRDLVGYLLLVINEVESGAAAFASAHNTAQAQAQPEPPKASPKQESQ